MEYFVKSVVPVIESNYSSFTNVEKNIADYFIHNQKKEDFSAKTVSEKLFVSEASLSRFAKKCGFRGYREFIYQYEEAFVESKSSVTGNTRTVLDAYQELLNRTYSLVDEKQIERVCKYLNQADRVFVCGKGSSGFSANEMEMRFMRIGVDINSITDSELMRMQSVFQDKKKLVIGISLSGDKEEVLYFLGEAHKRGAKTILFTANHNTALLEFCDELVLVPSLKYLDHGNLISPQFPVLVMLDIIFSYCVEQDKSLRKSHHDHTLRALAEGGKKKKVYEP